MRDSDEVIHSDREVSYSLTCCMVHGIRDGGRRANTCNLAHPFGANAAKDGVRLVNEFDLQRADVCLHGHLIRGDIVVEESTVARINFTRLAESRADAPDETTIELASCRAAAEHPAAIHHRNHSNDPRPGHAWRDVHLDELCDERECDVIRKFWARERDLAQRRLLERVWSHAWRRTAGLAIHVIQTVVAEDIRYTLALTVRTDQGAAIEPQARRAGVSELDSLRLCRKRRQRVAQVDQRV